MRLRVLGVGNLLQGDDGIGVRLAQELSRRTWPEGVEIWEVGMAGGPHLVGLWEAAEAVLILDAAQFGGLPGTLRRWDFLSPKEAVRAVSTLPEGACLDPHRSSVLPALLLAAALGIDIPVHLIGIQPASVQPGSRLSPEMERAWPRLVREVEQMIAQLLERGQDCQGPETGNKTERKHGQGSDH
jgi:hydrogenase maturation protease